MLKFEGYDWNLWLWWIVANSAGGFLGLIVFLGLSFILGASLPGATDGEVMSIGAQLTAAPIFGVAGLILGVMQWFVLRMIGESYLSWIIATGTGWLVGYMLAVLLFALAPSQSNTFMGPLILFLAIGLSIGVAQWYILRTRYSATDWWILATTIATIIGWAGLLVGGFCGTGLTWATAGAITGYVLLRITQPRLD